MKNTKHFALLGAALVMAFTGCMEKDEDEEINTDTCADCQGAIEHMCGQNIVSNGCNPLNMQQAIAKIEEHCGINNSGVFIGFMTERCILYGLQNCADCDIKDPGIPGLTFYCKGDLSLMDSVGIQLHISRNGTVAFDSTFVLPADGFDHAFKAIKNVYEGSTVTVNVYDKKIITQHTSRVTTFTFDRTDYQATRTARVLFDGSGFDVEFTGWH